MIAAIINSQIAIILLSISNKFKGNAYYAILLLFIYISLHFSYSTLPIFGGMKYYYLRSDKQIMAKIIGILFLLFISIKIFINNKNYIYSKIKNTKNKYILLLTFIWSLYIVANHLTNALLGNYPSILSLKDSLTVIFMMILAYTIYGTISDQSTINEKLFNFILIAIFILVVLMNAMSLCQIISTKSPTHAFAGFVDIDGRYIRRTSGLLFNPNVLGIWCAFVSCFSAYLFHLKKTSAIYTNIILFLLALATLMSGSRSGFLLSIFSLGLSSLLHAKSRVWNKTIFSFFPFIAYISSFISISVCSKFIYLNTKFSDRLIPFLSALVDRYASMPYELFNYFLFKFNSILYRTLKLLYEKTGIALFSDLVDFFSTAVKNHSISLIRTNIDGRINHNTPLPDNGFLAIYHDNGIIALILWITLWIVILRLGIKVFSLDRTTNSVYSVTAICSCIFVSVFIRSFQVFPVWVMISLLLGLSLSWFDIVYNNMVISEDT